jgi:very-short-patch-repair endonuclease
LQTLPNVRYERWNRTIAAPYEIDFFFPDLKLAVEINGITHYEPVFGEEQFKKRQKADRKKRELCRKQGVKVRTIRLGDCKTDTFLPRYKAVIREIENGNKT